jgi:hypothetical protein
VRNSGIFDYIDEAIRTIFPVINKLLIKIWNILMYSCIYVGLMPALRPRPWIFSLVIFVALALFIPVGVFLLCCTLAAFSGGANSDDDFIVKVDNDN